jgi:hypothetical protein
MGAEGQQGLWVYVCVRVSVCVCEKQGLQQRVLLKDVLWHQCVKVWGKNSIPILTHFLRTPGNCVVVCSSGNAILHIKRMCVSVSCTFA